MNIDFEIPEWIKATESDLQALSPSLPKAITDKFMTTDGLLADGPFIVEPSYRSPYGAMRLALDSMSPDSRTLSWVTGISSSRATDVIGPVRMKGDALVFKNSQGEVTIRPLRPSDAKFLFPEENVDELPVREILARIFADGTGW